MELVGSCGVNGQHDLRVNVVSSRDEAADEDTEARVL